MTSCGRPSYQPTDKDRRVVEMMAGWAIPEERIAKVLIIGNENTAEALRW